MRSATGNLAVDRSDRPLRCALTVTAPAAAARARKGSFSRRILAGSAGERCSVAPGGAPFAARPILSRSSGQ
ncbi:MAG: hypothetical protein DMF49_06865 [Acidobacteria bacterium]|nr:MAG: hypothetical protein DMF49_06865 [Acidobacteriota bacterium]